MNQDLKRTLWAAADKLHSSMDAAEYKHIELGLIFLKYVSDAFDEHRERLKLADKDSDLYLPDEANHAEALEERDYYEMARVFCVPAESRWEVIRASAKQTDIGVRTDNALEAIEAANAPLKGILDKRFGNAQLEPGKLGELVDLVSKIPFRRGPPSQGPVGRGLRILPRQVRLRRGQEGRPVLHARLGGECAGRGAGPHQGRAYDPCCGSGGMFVQSEKFIEAPALSGTTSASTGRRPAPPPGA